MASFDKRLAALEAGHSDPGMVGTVMAREADVTAWLLSNTSEPAEQRAVWGFILTAVDGRSKGLPVEVKRV